MFTSTFRTQLDRLYACFKCIVLKRLTLLKYESKVPLMKCFDSVVFTMFLWQVQAVDVPLYHDNADLDFTLISWAAHEWLRYLNLLNTISFNLLTTLQTCLFQIGFDKWARYINSIVWFPGKETNWFWKDKKYFLRSCEYLCTIFPRKGLNRAFCPYTCVRCRW